MGAKTKATLKIKLEMPESNCSKLPYFKGFSIQVCPAGQSLPELLPPVSAGLLWLLLQTPFVQ
jgi:hypothetical protein